MINIWLLIFSRRRKWKAEVLLETFLRARPKVYLYHLHSSFPSQTWDIGPFPNFKWGQECRLPMCSGRGNEIGEHLANVRHYITLTFHTENCPTICLSPTTIENIFWGGGDMMQPTSPKEQELRASMWVALSHQPMNRLAKLYTQVDNWQAQETSLAFKEISFKKKKGIIFT